MIATKALDRLRYLLVGNATIMTSTTTPASDDHEPSSSSSKSKKDHQPMTATATATDALTITIELLQGVFAIMLVYHSIRATFFPCATFGPSASMVNDIAICQNDDDNENDNDALFHYYIGNIFLLWALPSRKFCLAVLYTISGLRQGHMLWKAPIDNIRRAVVRRIVHSMLCGAAIMILSAMMSCYDSHRQVAAITNSMWLLQQPGAAGITSTDSTTPWVTVLIDLVNQMTVGLIHRSAIVQSNPALMFLSYEIMGTAIVSGLILLLKSSPHRLRSRWLVVLFIALLVPSATRTRRFDVQIGYSTVPSSAGSGITESITTRSINVDPIQHYHLLEQISDWWNTAAAAVGSPRTDTHPLSVIRFTFEERPPDSWYNNKKDGSKRGVLSLDDPTNESSSTSNNMIVDELWRASDNEIHPASTPWIDGGVGVTWGTEAPWMMLSSFVAGVWISEALLSTSSLSSSMQTNRLPAMARQYILLILPLAALLCGSYPETDQLVTTGPIWKVMRSAAGLFGLTGDNAYQLWSVIGSLLLMISVCWFCSASSLLVHNNESPPTMSLSRLQHLVEWSPMALSLFLVHLPILRSISCGVFLVVQPLVDNLFWSTIFALFWSVPFYLGIAGLFHKLVVRPGHVLSVKMSRQLLNMTADDSSAGNAVEPHGLSGAKGDEPTRPPVTTSVA